MGKKTIPFILLLALSLPIVLKLLRFEMNATADGWSHLFRQVLFNQSLVEGRIPPAWGGGAIYGFGTPTFLFYWSFPFYCIFLLMQIGIPLIPASHIFMAIFSAASSIAMYLFLRHYFDKFSSFVGSVFYLYAPYRLSMTFLYDSWGEVAALTLGVFLLYFVATIYAKPTKRKLFLCFLTAFFLILSHNAIAVIFFAMASTLALTFKPKVKFWFSLGLPVIGALISSCFFWVVSITENKGLYINELTDSFHRSWNYRSIQQIFEADINSILFRPAWYNTFTPGILIVLLGVLGILVFLIKRTRNAAIIWAIFWFVVPFVLMDYHSDLIWEKFYLLKMLLYPYRMIVFITVSGVFLSSYFISVLGKYKYYLAILIFVPIYLGYSFIEPKIGKGYLDSQYFYQDQPPYYAPTYWTLMGVEGFLPMKVPRDYLMSLQKNGKPKDFVEGEGVKLVGREFRNSYKATFEMEAVRDTRVSVNLFYFPGWRVKVNGKEAVVFDDDKGRVAFDVKAGKSNVLAEFGDTPVRAFLKIISLTGAVLFLVILVYLSIL